MEEIKCAHPAGCVCADCSQCGKVAEGACSHPDGCACSDCAKCGKKAE